MSPARRMTGGSPLGQAPLDIGPDFPASIGPSTREFVRVNVEGSHSIAWRVKAQLSGTTHFIEIWSVGPDGSRLGGFTPEAQVALSDNTEALAEYILRGERYIDLAINVGGLSAVDSIDYAMVFVKPRGR